MSFISRFLLFIIFLFSLNSEITSLQNCLTFVDQEINPNSLQLYLTFILPSYSHQINIDIEVLSNSVRSDQSELPQVKTLGSQSDTLQKMRYGFLIKYVLLNTNYNEVKSISLNGHKYCQSADNYLRNGFAPRVMIILEYILRRTSTPLGERLSVSGNGKYAVQNWGVSPESDSWEEDILSLGPNTDSTNNKPNQQETTFNFNGECGKKKLIASHTFIGGTEIEHNEFPWLVALFNGSRKYFCAGTLVSDRHVISAAHCTSNMPVVFMELGRHRLDKTSESGVYWAKSKNIINHPNYVKDTGHADISLIITTETIPFSNKIRPICIWPFESYDVGEIGTVAGWGNDRSGSYTKVPMSADIRIVSNADCYTSNDVYRKITSNTTFCAGGEGKGPCFGDSGSGFMVEKNNVWYLKGVVSVSIRQSYDSCDVRQFSVYCDVGKYYNWIKENV